MFAITALVFLAWSGYNFTEQRTVSVDMIELNHTYGDDGTVKFTQIILWEYSHEYRRWHIQAWSFVNQDNPGVPYRVGGVWYLDGITRVRSRLFRETWSTVDPERENHRLFPSNYRVFPWR